MQHAKITRDLLVKKINGPVESKSKLVALVAAAHVAAIIFLILIPTSWDIPSGLPFIPVALLFLFIAYKTTRAPKGLAEFIRCPECQKPLGIMEMKIALASESCCFCGCKIVNNGDAPNAA